MTITTEQILEWLREGIEVAAQCGYDDETRIVEEFEERVGDEFRDHSEAERAEQTRVLMEELRVALRKQREAESGWTDATINDRIDEAFEEFENHGIVALQNAGYTMSDGWCDVHEARSDVEGAWGAVFFHGQDVERAVQGEGLMLAFGAFVSGEEHEAESLRVAKVVCDVLKKHGVTTEWSGTVASRVLVVPFEWRRRRHTNAP